MRKDKLKFDIPRNHRGSPEFPQWLDEDPARKQAYEQGLAEGRFTAHKEAWESVRKDKSRRLDIISMVAAMYHGQSPTPEQVVHVAKAIEDYANGVLDRVSDGVSNQPPIDGQ